MDLDVGKLTINDAAYLGLFALGAAVGTSLLLPLGWAALPDWSASFWWPRVFVSASALILAGFLLGLAGIVAWLMIRGWIAYQSRLDDWHDVTISAFDQSGGKEEETSMTMTDVVPGRLADVLALALALHRLVQEGKTSAYTVRELQGGAFLAGRRLGEVSPSSARLLSDKFVELGLVHGRKAGHSGDWVPRSCDEVVELVSRNWR
jgi:hypothetical protein